MFCITVRIPTERRGFSRRPRKRICPILDMIGECALLKARPAITIGLTPVLLEQLSHDRFKAGFADILTSVPAAPPPTRKNLKNPDSSISPISPGNGKSGIRTGWPISIGFKRDIPTEFAQPFQRGAHPDPDQQCHTCVYAAHAERPVDRRADVGGNCTSSQQRLGVKPRGMWLPECAYRPQWDHWLPSVSVRQSPQPARDWKCSSPTPAITHFFVDTHLITGGHPMGTFDNGKFPRRQRCAGALGHPARAGAMFWSRSVSSAGPSRRNCFAFGRHPRVSEQVWSGSIGYPGNGIYLEFHKKHNERGLRYWKVTNNKAGLGEKDPYYPDDVPAKVYEHAQHFCNVVREVLARASGPHRPAGRVRRAVRCGTVRALVVRGSAISAGCDSHPRQRSERQADDRGGGALSFIRRTRSMRLPEGSWGEKGNHSVWINDRNRWMWEIEYRAENRMLKLLHELPWRTNEDVRGMMRACGAATVAYCRPAIGRLWFIRTGRWITGFSGFRAMRRISIARR